MKLLTLALLAGTAHAALFAQGNHARGLAHRRHGVVERAGAAYNETDHDSSASIEIGGAQRTSSAVVEETSSVLTSAASSSLASTTAAASSTVVPSSSSSSVAVVTSSSSSSVVPLTSSSTIVPTAASTSSSSTILSTSSSETPSSVESSSTPVSTSTSISSTTQLVSTIRSTVTDTSSLVPTSSGTTRGARTGSVSSKTASVSSTASAAAAGSEGTKSGISGGTKTAIIVVAVVGGIALGALALWTIIRKVKFRPTKRFDGRMRPLTFSPATPAFYEKTSSPRHSPSSADRQRMQFVDELEQEQYALPHHRGEEAYPNHDFTAGPASSYPQHEQYDSEDDYAPVQRGGSLNRGTFAGIGAGGAGMPGITTQPGYYNHAQVDHYVDEAPGLMREPSLGRPTRGEGPYAAAAATQFGAGRY